ncbi:DegT/DnrJ/EryC1/StrS family aminotransferase [Algoriphagus halophytocola]|uniref:DegT/DnrJ/EryC1/StrS family aminotransferase n=1 Tax=Algoriphagus halophytocola TaxID=2991499 RepID=A0ABY6MPC7_9BACT|nr:DegT/DnrJ/EryC1/StrS family aminotransferase [Algoriphagus sp. TR-M5]UZD24262.1 DegT/DnrJ/EryC1/StrS family aminotransferase [Algoriphagus sp. TR-M5]
MKVSFLDLKRIDEGLKDALKSKFATMLDAGVFSGGEELRLLESHVSRYLGSPYSIACANGTDALELALRALDVGSGDEVIVPALTWVSTAEVVKVVGAKPVFWDTDEDGLLAADWGKAITERTKAVIPVHLYGKMQDMESLLFQAQKHKLYVIEDAAQSFGSFAAGKAAGTFGDVGCLSFYPTKNLGALGEAGMCLTDSDLLNERIRRLLNHGQVVRDEHVEVGRNSRMDSVQAGFLNVFLQEFTNLQQRRKQLAAQYLDGLGAIAELKLPSGVMESSHNAHLFVVQTLFRDELKSFLADHEIGTAIHYPKILPDMQSYECKGDFAKARKLSQNGLSLPLNPWLKTEEVDYVISKVKEFFNQKSMDVKKQL